jgi:hypothetical protein
VFIRGDGRGVDAGGFHLVEQGIERREEQARWLFRFAGFAGRQDECVVFEAESRPAGGRRGRPASVAR